MTQVLAEYIWLDGCKTQELRSKAELIDAINPGDPDAIRKIPVWGFDGSSTEQAEGRFSDCKLKPVDVVWDPIRGKPNVLVMCEVLNSDDTPHLTNTRARLYELEEKYKEKEPLFGIEQEYTLFDPSNDWPYGWPTPWPKCLRWLNKLGLKKGFPEPQGRYYCGVGADKVFGRQLVEAHLNDCRKAGLSIVSGSLAESWGINAEVMPAQWEFQVGPLSPSKVSDRLLFARWLLLRRGEDFNIKVSFDPKPMPGDWNGAGAHTNFSDRNMRSEGGLEYIKQACEKLRTRHKEHLKVYGDGNERRLTGKHETCDFNTFAYGESNRGASIRIPISTWQNGRGYLEDRRAAANMNPYDVCAIILETLYFEDL